jgi:hypothetical protein
MKKKIFENISKALPSFFKNSTDYLKSNFEENGQQILGNASGTAAVITRLFAQPLIDNYFKKLSEKKIENFGLNTYLKAGFLQASDTLEQIKERLDNTVKPELIFEIINKSIVNEITELETKNILTVFQPKYHPAIVSIKNNYLRILKDINAKPEDIKYFLLDFNNNIEATISVQFGKEDYEKHLQQIDDYRFKENEVNFLLEMSNLDKIGFKESENLLFEKTFGEWCKTSQFRDYENETVPSHEDYEDNLETREKELKPIEELIDQYFRIKPQNSLEKILFIVADFGKGKSVFMKQYASQLAKNYINNGEGYFPVYFNLRNFKNYSSEGKLGVISDYLETAFSIKIEDSYFQSKKYIFLIDSLDESGELNKRAIDHVINSIKSIQKIDKTKYKTNRIIITSRPFDDGLSYHLNEHRPFTIKNEEGRNIEHFISAYGFKKTQFNNWLINTLKNNHKIDEIKSVGFAKKIIESISNDYELDIYEELLNSGTLSHSELRRPIFAYMIYQLIINNVDFLSVGKIGIYLSFLNLLTKEAKHIHDANYKVNLKEEFEFRNILHATSSLWMYQRHKGMQGVLKKADICRTVEGKTNNEDDFEIIERIKGQGLAEIQFLSHSYFGEENNVLHFQHQSFAEILLAEYYLKVFIKYAFDKNNDIEDARIKLTLGEPTEQTVLFLKEMLNLLKETSSSNKTLEIIEKRRLLFPLMASLATQKNNRLFTNEIFYNWYNLYNIEDNQTEYPKEALENWCIDENKLNLITNLSANIINSKNNYLLTKSESKTSLFDNEVIELVHRNAQSLPMNIDKWLSLVVGNGLYNNLNRRSNKNTYKIKLFNTDYKIDSSILFDMIRNWNFAFNDSCPIWAKNLFRGLDMRNNQKITQLSHYNLDGIDFSYSYLKSINSWSGNWCRTKMNYCTFNDVSFISCLFFEMEMIKIKKIINSFEMGNCQIGSNFTLFESFNFSSLKEEINPEYENEHVTFINDFFATHEFLDNAILNSIKGILIYGLQNSLFKIDDILKGFVFDSEATKSKFINYFNDFKIYEKS